MRNGQLTRVLCVMHVLREGRRTLGSLARDFGVTTRTVRRDLDALQDAGIPICKSGESDDADFDEQRLWWIA